MAEAMNHHVMTVAASTDEYVEWECSECEYRCRQFHVGRREVLTPSRSEFTHGGATKGLKAGVVVRLDDGLDVWRDALSD